MPPSVGGPRPLRPAAGVVFRFSRGLLSLSVRRPLPRNWGTDQQTIWLCHLSARRFASALLQIFPRLALYICAQITTARPGHRSAGVFVLVSPRVIRFSRGLPAKSVRRPSPRARDTDWRAFLLWGLSARRFASALLQIFPRLALSVCSQATDRDRERSHSRASPPQATDQPCRVRKKIHFPYSLFCFLWYNKSHGRLAQPGERSLDVRKVAGSIPVPSIFLCLHYKTKVRVKKRKFYHTHFFHSVFFTAPALSLPSRRRWLLFPHRSAAWPPCAPRCSSAPPMGCLFRTGSCLRRTP